MKVTSKLDGRYERCRSNVVPIVEKLIINFQLLIKFIGLLVSQL